MFLNCRDPFAADIPNGGDDEMFDGMHAEDAAAMDDFLKSDGEAEEDPFGEDTNKDEDVFGDAPANDDEVGDVASSDVIAEEDKEEVQESPAPEEVDETPNAMFLWRQEWRKKNDKKDEMARTAKEKRREEAHAALSQFYEQRESHKEKMAANNRAEETDFLSKQTDDKESENPWARIVSLIDTKEDADKDVSRMKEIMIQLKHSSKSESPEN